MAIEGRVPALRLALREALMTYGTAYFRSRVHAIWYYKPQYDEDYVHEMIERGDIHIGMPPLKQGETCFLIDNGCRWAIRTNGAKSK
jgi:hypothetical protein